MKLLATSLLAVLLGAMIITPTFASKIAKKEHLQLVTDEKAPASIGDLMKSKGLDCKTYPFDIVTDIDTLAIGNLLKSKEFE
jgi:hypothetical protein